MEQPVLVRQLSAGEAVVDIGIVAKRIDTFVGAAHQHAADAVSSALAADEAPSWHVLWGEPGTGKTLTAQRVRERVEQSSACNVLHWLQGDLN